MRSLRVLGDVGHALLHDAVGGQLDLARQRGRAGRPGATRRGSAGGAPGRAATRRSPPAVPDRRAPPDAAAGEVADRLQRAVGDALRLGQRRRRCRRRCRSLAARASSSTLIARQHLADFVVQLARDGAPLFFLRVDHLGGRVCCSSLDIRASRSICMAQPRSRAGRRTGWSAAARRGRSTSAMPSRRRLSQLRRRGESRRCRPVAG